MPNRSPIIFLLWGRHFEEAVAAIFVTELRAAGLCVKVVGLTGRATAGAHGLLLTPDLSLGQIPRLAQRALAVIIPCPLDRLLCYATDPRLGQFLQEAHHRQALFIVPDSVSNPERATQPPQTRAMLPAVATLTAYPDLINLAPFVRNLADRLRLS